jgi:hypothetical protein
MMSEGFSNSKVVQECSVRSFRMTERDKIERAKEDFFLDLVDEMQEKGLL